MWSALLLALPPVLVIPGFAYEAIDVPEAGTITGQVVFVDPPAIQCSGISNSSWRQPFLTPHCSRSSKPLGKWVLGWD